jgi:hypothetical protein
MTDYLTSGAVHDMTSLADWDAMLNRADTLAKLAHGVSGWQAFVPDATAVVEQMTDARFLQWRLGLTLVRSGRPWDGETEWHVRYGRLLLPDVVAEAALAAERRHTTLGVILLRDGRVFLKQRGFMP